MNLASIRKITNKKQAILFHHGMLGSARNWRPILMNSQIYTVADSFFIDARNHGDSPFSNSHTVENLADDLFSFITEQYNKEQRKWEKLVIVGHSMGGLALMQLTKKYPELQSFVEKVVIVDIPCNGINKKGWGQDGELEMLRNASTIDLTRPSLQLFREIQNISLNSSYSDLLKFNLRISSKIPHRWRANIPIIADFYSHLISYKLKKTNWKKPVSIIYGGQSTYMTENQVKDFLSPYPQIDLNKNIFRVDGAGHWVHVDNKSKFLDILMQIISS